jgi:anti-sigma factor RsiW
MECSLPPPITEDQISAVIDGFADPAVDQHIAQCASCAARLAQAQAMEATLKLQLNRWDCPPPQRLGEYHLGLVTSQSEERTIALHIDQCASCKAEVEDLRVFLVPNAPRQAAQPAETKVPAAAWPQRLGHIFARIVPRTPALALRGAATGPIMAEAEGTTIVLDVQPAAKGQVTILGQVVATDQDHWTGALVVLRQGGAVQATATADDLGSFSCGPLTAGPVELMISPSVGEVLVIPEIDVSAA